MKNKKILVIAAHPDDEVLGMGGTLAKLFSNNRLDILLLSDGEKSREIRLDVLKRQQQAQTVAKKLEVDNLWLENLPDNQFDTWPLLKIVKVIEKYLLKTKPEIVYTHHQFDLNIDHQITFKAVLTACRPQPNYMVKKIISFEVLSATEWQSKDNNQVFLPNLYINIVKTVDKKVELMKIYKDELRQWPHPRSLKGIKTLAEYRGMEIGVKFAEAFKIVRQLNE